MSTAVVIGSGLAGLSAALRLDDAGYEVTVVTMGLGGLQLSQGTIDVLGYAPDRVDNPLEAAATCEAPHPYATIPADDLAASVDWIAHTLPDLLTGSATSNVTLPTAVGAMRPTALYQPSMSAGIIRDGGDVTIVGFRQYKDFYPELIAGNLSRTPTPDGGSMRATSYWVDLPARPGEADSSALSYARAFDNDDMVRTLAWELTKAPGAGALGLPAFLGLKDATVYRRLGELVGREVFEIAGLPPSIPGMRLNEALRGLCLSRRIRLVQGAKAIGFTASGDRISRIRTHAAGRDVDYAGDVIVMAGGGFESGALEVTSHGRVREPLFDLPLYKPDGALVHGDYWGAEQPLFTVGVRTDADMRPVDANGAPCYSNLFAAGSILAGSTRWQEKSGEGIALASAWAAARAAAEMKEER